MPQGPSEAKGLCIKAAIATAQIAHAAQPYAKTSCTVSPPMNLGQVLPPGSVQLNVPLDDKLRAISHVAGLLAAASGVARDTIEAALIAREALGSTGVGSGVGLPHARLHSLRKTHAVFLRAQAPIGFESIDGRPVDLLCAVIAPDEPNAELLTAVSAVSRVLRDAEKTAALRECGDPDKTRRILLGDAVAH